jgi:hypothetical protein
MSVRYYIGRSDVFDRSGYPTKKIAALVKKGGGYNVRLSKLFGDPKNKNVVCFSTTNKHSAEIIAATVAAGMMEKYPEFERGVWALKKNW